MKKILLLCDGNHFPKGAFDAIISPCADNNVKVVGVFLSQVEYSEAWPTPLSVAGDTVLKVIKQRKRFDAKSKELFIDLCEKNKISYGMHEYDAFNIHAIEKETRYADLVLMSGELFYYNLKGNQPNSRTKSVLHGVECPVMLVPEKFTVPERVVLSFDGSAQSVYAIKQFAYLFPQWTGLETTLVFASNKNKQMPDVDYIQEFAAAHFNNLSTVELPFDPYTYLSTWLSQQTNCVLVAGSFARSAASTLFKHSFVTDTIADHEMPVFIAHK